ncbi:hypothetical protein [Jannaschia ovalis]|uniref:Uncharacterized protein n=1 Tax=Jannaschia ovalis TaxID=3038773 RepID=A0ABY8LC99_9RHOB|nr:hypothetical protein [Jannaschia sp. GRR-S6-38]WGH78954.1 hypothetical protein P8627_01455 [Jannaschia sp. GRR-S6-38]
MTLFDEPDQVSKRELIYAASVFPKGSLRFSDDSAREIAYKNFGGGGGGWDYTDLPKRLADVYKGTDRSTAISSARALPGKGEGSAKAFILEKVFLKFDPSEWSAVTREHSILERDEFEIPISNDIYLRRASKVISLFIVPYSQENLSEDQEKRLLQLLGSLPHCREITTAWLFCAPEQAGHRQIRASSIEPDYFDIEETLDIIITFKNFVLQARR